MLGMSPGIEKRCPEPNPFVSKLGKSLHFQMWMFHKSINQKQFFPSEIASPLRNFMKHH